MGRKSVKENKNIYQIKREEVGLTRERASEKLYISSDTLERIENRGQIPQPETVLNMAETYREPLLCNYYCTKECAIGQKYVSEVPLKNLSEIVLGMKLTMDSLLEKDKQSKLMKIAEDNKVGYEEIDDFICIQEDLQKMAGLIETLRFWSEEMVAEGKIDKTAFEQAMKKHGK